MSTSSDCSLTISKPQYSENHLKKLPQEILFLLFKYLRIDDIGSLCITSKRMRDLVQIWIESMACVNRITGAVALDGQSSEETKLQKSLEYCRQFGILAKRTTFLFNTQRRMDLLQSWFSRHHIIPQDLAQTRSAMGDFQLYLFQSILSSFFGVKLNICKA